MRVRMGWVMFKYWYFWVRSSNEMRGVGVGGGGCGMVRVGNVLIIVWNE
jgi:hypothetical protein